MSKGITLIAIGLNEKGAAYGKFAYNLAVSLRYHSPSLPIQLICNQKGIAHLSDDELELFDHVDEIEQAHCFDGGVFMPSKAKMYMYDYLRFDETIYLDVDTLVVKDITPLFDECKDGYYYTTVVATADKSVEDFKEMQWANIDDIWEHYELNGHVLPATNSSFQYIRKGEESENLFRQIQANFRNKMPVGKLKMTWGSGKQPDELYLNIALAQIGLVPSLDNEPICYRVKERLNLKEDLEKHYALSLYGGKGFTHSSIVAIYDRMMMKITNEIGKQHRYKISSLMKHKYVDTK